MAMAATADTMTAEVRTHDHLGHSSCTVSPCPFPSRCHCRNSPIQVSRSRTLTSMHRLDPVGGRWVFSGPPPGSLGPTFGRSQGELLTTQGSSVLGRRSGFLLPAPTRSGYAIGSESSLAPAKRSLRKPFLRLTGAQGASARIFARSCATAASKCPS